MEPKEPLGPPELPKGNKPAAQPVSHSTLPAGPYVPMAPAKPAEDDLPEEPDVLNEHVADPGDPDGLVAAEEHQKWVAEHPKPDPSTPKTRRKKRRWPLVLLVIVLIAAAAYGAYWYGSNQASKTSKSADDAKTQGTSKQDSTATPKTPAKTVATKNYSSTTYTLAFDYPEDWKISDTAAKLLVVSPTRSLETTGGSTVQGHVVLTIQNQQTTIAGYPENGAVAVLESKKLTYKAPTSVQRAQTYLTYLGYGQSSALDVQYVTGDNGYQKDQNVPMADVVKGNPLVSVTFQSCTSEDCATGTPTLLTISASKWQSMSASAQVEDLLKSIQLD